VIVTPPDFRFRWSDLPPLSAALPGSGGCIRETPGRLRGRRAAPLSAEGSGSHAYALVEKRGLTTRDLVLALLRQGLRRRRSGSRASRTSTR
jgi:tRNA pseudouridine13 synthase